MDNNDVPQTNDIETNSPADIVTETPVIKKKVSSEQLKDSGLGSYTSGGLSSTVSSSPDSATLRSSTTKDADAAVVRGDSGLVVRRKSQHKEKKSVSVSDDDDQNISRNVVSGVFNNDSDRACASNFPIQHSYGEGFVTEKLVTLSTAYSDEPPKNNGITPTLKTDPYEPGDLKTVGSPYHVNFPDSIDRMNEYLENVEQTKNSTSTSEKVDLHNVNELRMVKEPTTSPIEISDEDAENVHPSTGMEKCIQPIPAVQTQISETKPEKDGQNTTCTSEGIRNITEPSSVVPNLQSLAEYTEQYQLEESEIVRNIEIQRLELIELADQLQSMLERQTSRAEEREAQLQNHTLPPIGSLPTSLTGRMTGWTSRRRGTGMTEAAIDQLSSLTDSKDASYEQKTCTICLCDIQTPPEDVRELPCCHVFHFECIKPYLKKHIRCPICQMYVVGIGI